MEAQSRPFHWRTHDRHLEYNGSMKSVPNHTRSLNLHLSDTQLKGILSGVVLACFNNILHKETNMYKNSLVFKQKSR